MRTDPPLPLGPLGPKPFAHLWARGPRCGATYDPREGSGRGEGHPPPEGGSLQMRVRRPPSYAEVRSGLRFRVV